MGCEAVFGTFVAMVRWRVRFGTFSGGFPLLGEAGVRKLKVDEMVALAKSKISMFEKGGADVEILHKYSNAENLLLCPS